MPRRFLPLLVAAFLVAAVVPFSSTALAADSIFTKTDGFATKTGYRFVFSWQASQPVSVTVQFGTDPANLNQTATAFPPAGVPDTAGLAIADNRTLVGRTIYWRAVDGLSGQASEIKSFVAQNAYTAWDATDQTYTLNVLVTLDTESLPAEVPSDVALENLADGMNIFAERLYDAMDGYARLGKVLITDTNLDYPVNVPDALPVSVTGGGLPVCHPAGNLADIQIETAPPFDSHTWGGWAIDKPCVSFYIGREGQLVVPWEDDLHLGYVSTHEMMHYAFNAPDLYNVANVNQTAPIANDGQSWCRNEAWDGSVMHNTGGWSGLRWVLSELDRNPVTTPCDHEGKPYTWDALRVRYTNVPDSPRTGPVGTGIQHMVDDQARGNEDGGKLDISVLDRQQATSSSTCTSFTPDDTNDPKPPAGDSCSENGAVILGDGAGDSTPGQGAGRPEHDLRELRVSEPAELGSGKILFRLKVESLATTPPNTTWPVVFKDQNGQDRFVRMSTNPLQQVSFASGVGTNADPIANPGTPADPSSSFSPDGTIRIVVNRANIGNPQPGAQLTQFQSRVRFEIQTSAACSTVIGVTGPLPPPALCPVAITPDNMPDDLGRVGSYTIVGSENCANVNTAPVATADETTTSEDTFVTVDVLANDYDADGDTLAVTGVSSPEHGSATRNPDGTVTYFPEANFHGTDSFTYGVEDGDGALDTATVTVVVASVNDDPTGVDDSATAKKNKSVLIPVLGNDSDVDGDPLAVSAISQPVNGSVTVNSDGSVTYTPKKGFTGSDSFIYNLSDGQGGTGSALVNLSVTK